MLTLSSGDTMHQFALDVDKDGARFIGSCPVGDTCSSVFTPSSGTSISITTASLAPSTYTYFCTFHSSMVGSFVVSPPPDFSITPNPTSLTLAPSSSGTTSITLTSTNGFSGTLTLSATVSPSGPQVSLNPTSVSLSAGGSVPSTLTVSTVSSGYYSTPVAQGNYAVNITASSGSLVHSTSVPLTVGSTSSAPPSSPSLPLLPIAGGVIAAIAVAGVALFLRRRSR